MAKRTLSGLSGGKKKSRKGGSYKGWKQVSKKACVKASGKGKGRLKKGCKWGRGKYRGRVFKKVG